ncbi:carboxypeptidase-like regulatory domain-containing protein [Mucilaginibacter galii]|uniref:TonB-dependent receptor n=1 Tax=Mucilaginibacter galii TaxID=2005073 RepID=A0A917JAI2_9SPHI|nr:carboxypeptidase-like regulatory domain-containing protein [Mucilaginibacter galii]GGI51778.1 TonB-dependent receptor [Mucilaginibacter galii]
MNLKKLFAGVFVMAALAVAFAFITPEDDPIQKIVAQLEKWTTDHPQEKVYLQLDKPYYGVGDNIWLKAYITIGAEHRLSAISGALNIELINDQDSVKQWIKLPVTSGITWGDFALSDTLQEGTYRIRAYTNWMRNAGPEYFFEKSITIGNAATNNVFTKTSYKYSKVNNAQKVDAVINYADLDNLPYAGKEVSYAVKVNDKQILKSKGTTDAQGNLSISFLNTQQAPLTSGIIVTNIKVDDKKTINKNIILKTTSGQADVQFFPESGNLVNGVRSRVAFKAVGPNGLGVDIKGMITDNNNAEVAQLTTRHLGMGVFALTPEAGKTYKAQITYPDGSQNTVALPAAAEQGFVMTINNADTAKINLRVTGGAGTNAKDNYIVAQSGGVVCYVARNSGGQSTFSALIPKNKFPSGIAQFTLFTAAGQPLNERIAFIQRDADMLTVKVSASAATSAPRQKVKINLNAANSDGKPVVGVFSASVIDESKVQTDEAAETSILSHLLLTSDLKGFVEQPNYYFTKPNEKTNADLDVLMLTQGYRRFEWKSLLADQIPAPAFQAEKTLQISGTVKTLGGKPVPNSKVMLFTTAGGTFILDTVADAQGKFAFKNLLFKDSIRFVIQARTAKNSKNVEITLDNLPSRSVVKNVRPQDVEVGAEALNAYLKFSKKQYDEEAKYGLGNHTILLKEVTVTEKRKSALTNSSNLNGAGNADQVITADVFEKIGCATIDQCLQGRLVGVIFRGGVPYSTRSFNTPMQIILDGVYVESDFLLNISPFDVASVEVLRTIGNTAIYGSRGSGGVLLINTKRGGDYNYSAANIYSPGIITYTPKGFYAARQFYAPKYDDPKTNVAIADLRTTIHWVPNIITDSNGNASFEYFNAGTKGTYRVVVEGLNDEGHLGRQVFSYQVQ